MGSDLEITKACAEAMGVDVRIVGDWAYLSNCSQLYSPMDDDEQAMGLIKKFRLSISGYESGGWIVCETANSGDTKRCGKNLNRAICECVAKMEHP